MPKLISGCLFDYPDGYCALMDIQADTDFSRFLLQADPVRDAAALAGLWHDQTVIYRLENGRKLQRPDLGAHLRRSFLGALAAGASPGARNNLPCPWDPPCGLDIFLREQLRGSRGDGLPKPYVIFSETCGNDLLVSLRVFGMANDWFMLAAEAMLAGMRDLLPWQRIYGCDLPVIGDRQFQQVSGLELPSVGDIVRLKFISAVDAGGGKAGRRIEPSLLSRLLRRIDGLARWQGVGFTPDYGREMAAMIADLDYSQSALRPGTHISPSRHRKTRPHKTMQGMLVVIGDLTALLPVLAIGERCHMGRAAVEGMGRYRMICATA